MHPQIAARMGGHRGLVLRREALAAGLSVDEVDRLVRTGAWVAVRRGVYTSAARWSTLDEHAGRPLLRAWAASLNMSHPHVLSHESAALAHGMAILRPREQLVHVTRFGVQGSRLRHGVCHHLAPFEPWQVVDVAGVPTLDPARTAVDIARNHGMEGLRYGVVACDAALRVGATRRELREAVAPMRSWAQVTIAREAVAMADPGAESPAESLARLLVAQLGVGAVVTQYGLEDERRTAYVDLRVGRHLIEVDGLVKYQRGGLADRPAEQVVWEEKRRQDWLCGFKLGMSRLVWDDLTPGAWERTGRWLLREILDTHARYGTDLGDLAPYLAPPRRP